MNEEPSIHYTLNKLYQRLRLDITRITVVLFLLFQFNIAVSLVFFIYHMYILSLYENLYSTLITFLALVILEGLFLFFMTYHDDYHLQKAIERHFSPQNIK